MVQTFGLVALLAASFPTVFAAVYHVTVGADSKLAYNPQYVKAVQGDTIRFLFHPKNHTVTESAFPLGEACSSKPGGFDSEFQPVANVTSYPPAYDLLVHDEKPVWVYCRQTGHCGAGMVFAVNPPESGPNTFGAFQDRAKAAGSAATPIETTPAQHQIIVGLNGKLEYGAHNIAAAVGDVVEFSFRAKNHTVTQSSFDEPCKPLDGGFKSGFQPVNDTVTADFPTFRIKINDTKPIWGYCGQKNPVSHCGAGMVFAINAVDTSARNFGAFQDLAKQAEGASAAPSIAGVSSVTTETHWWDASQATPEPKPSPSTTESASGVTHTSTPTATSELYGSSAITTSQNWWDEQQQDNYPSGTETQSAPAYSATPAEHRIIVGLNGVNTYGNNDIQAAPGDIIIFEFHAKNHTVTQSSFSSPCTPLEGGFKSGFIPVDVNATTFPEWRLTINDTAPIWGYCGQKLPVPHCNVQGMVFAINAVESGPNNFSAFQASSNQTSTTAAAVPTNGNNVQLTSNVEDEDASVPSSKDFSTLVRNGYIIIGLLAAIIIMVIALISIVATRERKSPKYSQVSTAGPSVPIFDATKPYSTPYADYHD